ncbi:phage tail tip lysozyme [Cytobacillus pseudoceanisediminis]|uniref:phage tail tip lysozyme n=1 Tax=Cytobacillus pseudoceanisediminis TaxID=3051614 RepID=UPI00218C0243|nr:phage tail tip lysozyme [Cytobacillus pseudoceanisediminis]UQX56051.1 phage tail tip lysozyme [Cytobacillus pseudoceanisediminis]
MLAKLQYNEHFYKQALKGNTELVKQFHKLYGVDLNSFKNLAAAKWKIEERVLEKISKAWSNHYTQAMHAASAIQMATGNHFSGSLLAMLNQSKIASSFAGMQMSFNDIFMDQIDLATGASIANNGLADSTEKAGKALESSTYISDKYKQALESVNLQLEKQRAIKAKFPQHSKEYQNALKNEIKLLDQQKKLIQEQAKSLDSQIKSGKIMEVGRVVTSKSSSSTSVSSGGTSSQIWNFFKSKGFTDSVVAGIMGNLQLESGLNPNALNKSSGAFGIAQWLGGRKTGLSNYAASMGTSISDLNTQLNFLWKELKSTEKRTLNYLNSNQGASEASIAAAFDRLFERSEGTHIPQRQQFANQFLSQFRGTSGGTYSEASKEVPENMASVDSAKSQLLQLQQDAIAVEQQMQELFMDLVDAQLSSFDRIKNSYSDDLAKIDLIQRRETQGSKEWLIQQAEKEDIIDKQIEQEKKAVKFLKEQIKANKDLNAAQRSLLEDQLVDRYQELYSLEQNLLDEGISMAEQTIDTYKKAAEAQKNAAIKAIDEIINGINKEAEEADYKKKLENAQKSRQEILDEIAKLSIDDSFAAKKRIEELRKQFQEQEESIENMQDEKSRQDRIDSLNEQKENIESDYDNLINDERKFAQMRSDIINGNTKQIQKDLVKYYANIKANANVLGKALSNNLIDLINQANKYLNGKDYKPIKVAQAKNGGILPSWGSQGKAMIVHEEEMISNKHDTKNLLAAMGMSEKLVNALSNFKVPSILPNVAMPKLQSPPNVSNKTVGDTYFNVHIDNINGDSSLKYTMEKVAEAALKKSYENMVSGVKIIGGKM